MKKPRSVVVKNDRFYFQATKAMREAGIASETLPADEGAAFERARELLARWDDIRASRTEPQRGDFADLIDQFQRDPSWYGKLAAKTREEVDYALTIFAADFGAMRIGSPQRQHFRAFYNRLRVDGSAHKANKVLKWVHRLLEYAVEMGVREYNPIARMRKESTPGRSQVWHPDQISALIAACIDGGKATSGNLIPPRPSIALAVQLAYDTSQRPQDVLAARRHGLVYDEDFEQMGWDLTQKKTGTRLWVPLSDESLRMIDQYGGDLYLVISEESARPYSKDAFTRIFRKFARRAGVPDELQFRDLRRTAATEMGNSGATNTEISSHTGHTPDSTVIKTYVRPDRRAAIAGAEKRKR